MDTLTNIEDRDKILLFDTLILFLKEFVSEKVDKEKISRKQKGMQNFPECKESRKQTKNIYTCKVTY